MIRETTLTPSRVGRDAGHGPQVGAHPAEPAGHDLPGEARQVRLVGPCVAPVGPAHEDHREHQEAEQQADHQDRGVQGLDEQQRPRGGDAAEGGQARAGDRGQRHRLLRPSSTCQVTGVAHCVFVTGPVGPLLNDGACWPQWPVNDSHA